MPKIKHQARRYEREEGAQFFRAANAENENNIAKFIIKMIIKYIFIVCIIIIYNLYI